MGIIIGLVEAFLGYAVVYLVITGIGRLLSGSQPKEDKKFRKYRGG